MNVSVKGTGFGTLLFLVFLVLKLCHVIAWSWLWITAPLWIPLVIAVVISTITLLILIVQAL